MSMKAYEIRSVIKGIKNNARGASTIQALFIKPAATKKPRAVKLKSNHALKRLISPAGKCLLAVLGFFAS